MNFFGLGFAEMIVIGLCCALPLIGGAVAGVVLMATRRPPPDRHDEREDERRSNQ